MKGRAMTASRAKAWAPTIGCAVLGFVLMSSGVAFAQEHDLSGDWVIDFADSDEPAEVFEAFSQRRSERGGVGVGIGIFGVPVEVGRGGGRGSEPAEVVRRDLRRLRRHLSANVDELGIEQSPERVRVIYADMGTVDYREGELVEDGEETAHAEWRRFRPGARSQRRLGHRLRR